MGHRLAGRSWTSPVVPTRSLGSSAAGSASLSATRIHRSCSIGFCRRPPSDFGDVRARAAESNGYSFRSQRLVMRAASPPGAQITSALTAPFGARWRTASGGRTAPTMPGFRTTVRPLTECSSSPDST